MHKQSWGIKDFTDRILVEDSVYLRYCKEKDIIKKRFMFLKFKGCFLARHKYMSDNGQSLQL